MSSQFGADSLPVLIVVHFADVQCTERCPKASERIKRRADIGSLIDCSGLKQQVTDENIVWAWHLSIDRTSTRRPDHVALEVLQD